ncbi:unnamed protein product [Ixodes hexagonus]
MNKQKSDAQARGKPFENYKFYLDFKGYRPHTQLVRDLKILGAVVEPFFGRDVNYVITDKPNCKNASASRKPNSVDSSGHTTSPFSNECSHDLPCTSDAKVIPRIARGQAMVQRAVQPGPTDILELCRQWRIKTIYIKDFLPCLQQMKQKTLLAAAKSGKENAAKTKPKSDVPQKLVPPFIKFEDSKCIYKPLFKSLKQWPHISTEQFPEPVPKTIAVPAQEHATAAQTRGVLLTPDTAKTIPNAAPKIKVTEQKKFNCEICSCSYLCLQKHLESDSHQHFMRNDSNFSMLSDLVSTLHRAAPSCLPGPLTEIHQGNPPSADGGANNERGGKVLTPRAMLSVKGEHSSIIVQSTYCGTLSSVKHLKVVRGLTEPSCIGKAAPESPKTSTTRKRPLLRSDTGPTAVHENGDNKLKVCCSDPLNAEKEDHLVPPSHSTDVDGVENSLLANICVENSVTDGKVAVEGHSNLEEGVQIGSSRDLTGKPEHEIEIEQEPSTMEYSWTDFASGFAVVNSSLSRKRRTAGSANSDGSSFSKFVSGIGVANFSQGSDCKDASDTGRNGLAEEALNNIMRSDSSFSF